MTRDTLIHLQKELHVTELSGDKVMIDFESGKYYMIQGAGNAIWDIIQNDITVGNLIDQLLSEYDVSPEECEASVIDFLSDLQKNKIIA